MLFRSRGRVGEVGGVAEDEVVEEGHFVLTAVVGDDSEVPALWVPTVPDLFLQTRAL